MAENKFIFGRERNLLLIAWNQPGKNPDLADAKRELKGLRDAFPAGSAVLNLTAGPHPRVLEGFRRTFFGAAFGWRELGDARHLGTAHLFQATGLRALAMRSLFQWLERPDGDIAKAGNHVVRSVDEASDWLFARLSSGPVSWTRHELRRVIAAFVVANPLQDHDGASRPAA